MRKVLLIGFLFILAGLVSAADISGKLAFGFEQGVGVGDPLGRGCSFKMCLSNNIAVQGAVGFNYSGKLKDVVDPITGRALYIEDKARVDFTAAAYGILVFRRFEHVHLNGMTGILLAFQDNHFKKESDADAINNGSFTRSGDSYKKTDIHLRVLMAPEIFIFPNFSLEYKYGFDIALKKEMIFIPASDNPYGRVDVPDEQYRLIINTIGDLDLLQSGSVHFYF